MHRTSNFGIVGLGYAVPKDIVTNDYWPQFFEKSLNTTYRDDVTVTTDLLELQASTAEQAFQIDVIRSYKSDPFRGSKRRRRLSQHESLSSLEIEASRMALERSGIDGREIDYLICHSAPSDRYSPGNGGLIQRAIGATNATFVHVDNAWVTNCVFGYSPRCGRTSC